MLGKGFAWHIALPEEANRDTDVLANRRFRMPLKVKSLSGWGNSSVSRVCQMNTRPYL